MCVCVCVCVCVSALHFGNPPPISVAQNNTEDNNDVRVKLTFDLHVIFFHHIKTFGYNVLL